MLDRGAEAICEGPDDAQHATLDWCFGSGRHARTWLGVMSGSWGETESLEFRWSWYSQTRDFAVTPGQRTTPASGYFAGLGVLYDQPKTERCFGCHASHVPVTGGRIDMDGVVAGVRCQRCHGPMQEHVRRASGSETYDADPFWRRSSPAETVRRCGQCHRRPEDLAAGDVHPDNPNIVRFQSVGLVQAACFIRSGALDCTTCHDPHTPLERQDSAGDWQCVQCHDPPTIRDSRACSAGLKHKCVGCHMPRRPTDSPMLFTDHWIRVPPDHTPPGKN
jgi:hypothetical protein